MVSIRNIEKFFKDHPEFSEHMDVALEKAKTVCEEGTNMIASGGIEEILGSGLTAIFFKEVSSDMEHLEIGHEDMGALMRKT